MAVSEQTPYIEYVANGVTTSFPLGFDCDKKEHLVVKIDDVTVNTVNFSLLDGVVIFNTAPISNAKITFQRDTPLERNTEYQSFNNSFRPQPLNGDFDRIWWKLQELWVQVILLWSALKKEIKDRIESDLEIRSWVQVLLSNIASDGILNTLAITAVGSIADLQNLVKWDGRTIQVKSYHAPENFAAARPFRGGGEFIYIASRSAENDGGTVFNGWVRIFDKITIDDFGAIANTETQDSSIAIQKAANFCAKNHLTLHFNDGQYLCLNEIKIDGAITAFRNVRWKGTFIGTGTSAGYGWWIGQQGTTIITKGNNLLEVWFRRFFNENMSIDGIAVVNDSSTFPTNLAPYAIKVKKGDFANYPTEFRYVTGLLFDNFAPYGFTAGVLFRGDYKKTEASGYLSNYIGNTTFKNFYPYQCGSGIVVENATLNRLSVADSLIFKCSLGGIIKREAIDLAPTDRTEMLIMCQLHMVHFEDCRGMFRFFGQPPVNEFLNYITMNDVTRELCGLYDSTTGNPYGIVEYTNIIINGRHDQFGEAALPMLGVGSTLTTQVNMSASLIASGAKSLSPEKINLTRNTYNLLSGTSNLIKSLTLAEGIGYPFDIETNVIINDGTLGRKTFKSVGKTQSGTGGRFHSEIGALASGITVSANTASDNVMQEFIVSNTTGSSIKVDIVVNKNVTGVQCYLA